MSSIDNLKKEAKRRLKALRASDSRATLRGVQQTLAREHGFADWKTLSRAVQSPTPPLPPALTALEAELLAGIEKGQRDVLLAFAQAHPHFFNDQQVWLRLIVHAIHREPPALLARLLEIDLKAHGGLTSVNIEMTTGSGWTPLHEAASAGQLDAVAVLLRHGANAGARDRRCETPAAAARRAGHDAAAERILDFGGSDLFDAIDADRADLVARIVDRDPAALDRPFAAYASCPDGDGQARPAPDATPMQWATARGKARALEALTERGAGTRTPADIARAERAVALLQSACWDQHTHGKADHRMFDRAAARILAQEPSLATSSLYAAIVCGELDTVRRIVAERPELARQPGGPRAWTPILYSAYTRFSHPHTIANAVEIARVLLDAGADPNDFYMAGDARYSVLTGIAGEGEQDSPRQPYAAAMYRLLLDRGAEPFDIQVLYNTHFSGDVLWWLELTYDATRSTARGVAWDDPDWKMLDMGGYGNGARFLLGVAIGNRDLRLAEWCLARGANPNAIPPRDKRMSKVSLYEAAVREGATDIATLLLRYGASPVEVRFDEEDKFLRACFALDRDAAIALAAAHPEFLRSTKAMFKAAQKDRPDVLALLVDLGVPADIRDDHNTSALHHAAGANALRAAAWLIEHGVEIDPRETTWGGRPIGWASHGDRVEMIDLLSRHSRNLRPLALRGYVDRLREILGDEPSLARQVADDGTTPLWWLPDDEPKAMQLVELMLAAGVDPTHRDTRGETAADSARRRGMFEAARRLESRA